MRHLKVLRKYFFKYKHLFFGGILFVTISNYFGVLAPQLTGYIVDKVRSTLGDTVHQKPMHRDFLVNKVIDWVDALPTKSLVMWCGISILLFAILRGFFMFLMRQTLIVMSRHIEFDQKNEIYQHYQQLDAQFYKVNSTGDLMNRIAEDVSRVRMYTGPAIMYLTNLLATISFVLFFMFRTNAQLTWYVIAPLPLLAITIYFVNSIINAKSEKIQEELSNLTANAQESYSGIRVIKSFVQENAMLRFFSKNAESYRQHAVSLAKTEAIYFPSMTLMIGLSVIITIFIGAKMQVDAGLIVEFVMYVNMLMFPVSAIGYVASMTQRAAASQKRINEFLEQTPQINNAPNAMEPKLQGDIRFSNVQFTYAHTGITAINNLSFHIKAGQKVAIIGRTGSGKTTIAQLLLRMFDAQSGSIALDGHAIEQLSLNSLRNQISYVPQDVFLFSDSIAQNIQFGLAASLSKEQIADAAKSAGILKEINSFKEGFDTLVGERGVTLSGGQKQRISIARALSKNAPIIIFDDCLSAVDAKTENEIVQQFNQYLKAKTGIIITHRIFNQFQFDKILVLEDGELKEMGTHETLLAQKGIYASIYEHQQQLEIVALKY
jgi:ATP-binding cassette, subfamily B, multidrug efflux pump